MKFDTTEVAVAGIPLAVVARRKLSEAFAAIGRLGAYQAGRAGVGHADRTVSGTKTEPVPPTPV